jgi:hypothetical protein
MVQLQTQQLGVVSRPQGAPTSHRQSLHLPAGIRRVGLAIGAPSRGDGSAASVIRPSTGSGSSARQRTRPPSRRSTRRSPRWRPTRRPKMKPEEWHARAGRVDQAGRQGSTPQQPLGTATVDAIARRIVELLGDQPFAIRELVDAEELARRFGLSRAWVYSHADELGALRVGAGPRSRLRFDPRIALERLTSRSAGEMSQSPGSRASKPISGRKTKGRVSQKSNLLPIRTLK